MTTICEVCSKLRSGVHRNCTTGLLTCAGCYRQNHAPKKKCVVCEKLRRVSAYLDEDVEKKEKPVCPDCYLLLHFNDESRFEICSVCCELRPVYSRENGVVLCPTCYSRDESTHEICSLCGDKKRVNNRGINGEAICDNCRKKTNQSK